MDPRYRDLGERIGHALRVSPVVVALALVLAVALLASGTAASLWAPFGPQVATAASASPSEASGDLRSGGEGAGAAGNPGFALVAAFGVVAGAVLIAGATTIYVRLTSHPDR